MTTARGAGPTPVIVGVGEVVQRPDEGGAEDPLSLAVAAARLASDDAGASALLTDADSVDVVNIVSWSYDDAAARLAEAIGARPARAVHSAVGGHQPTALLDAAAARIARGESAVAVVAGGEAMRTLETAMKAGEMPAWPPSPSSAQPVDPRDHATGAMADLELFWPTDVYPLYEQASRRAAGLTQDEARAEAAQRWAAASEVAATNPSAWIRTMHTAEQIATVTPGNRLVAWPYPKLLNALLGVDQAAAVIVTSTDRARALGIDEDRWVFPWGGAAADEPDDVLARSTFERTTAGATVLDRALRLHAVDVGDLDLLELYSCFPCVPRMAAAHLGLHPSTPTTITGGLTFFGGPANDYMLHAVAAMVRRLRDDSGQLGLLYGQGGYATKHHALLLSTRPPKTYGVDDRADAQRIVADEPAPRFDPGHRGPASLETFTMPYGRDGTPERIVAVGRTPDGARCAGEMAPSPEVVDVLTHPTDEPLGRSIVAGGDGDTTRIELA